MNEAGSYDPSEDDRFQSIIEPELRANTAPQVIRYAKPEVKRQRHVVKLATTEAMFASMQVIRNGGENRLHSHPTMDGFWFVLKGRVRFYTTNDEVLAEIGPNEAVLTPHDYPYWFESVGPEDLELLQVEAFTGPGKRAERVLMSESEIEPDFEVSEA